MGDAWRERSIQTHEKASWLHRVRWLSSNETLHLEKKAKSKQRKCKAKKHQRKEEQPRKQQKAKQVQPKKHKQRKKRPRKQHTHTHLKHSLTWSNQKVHRGNVTTRTTSPYSKGLCRLAADSEFNALEPSLARGPGRVRKTRVFHPRNPADWCSGAGSSASLLVAFFSGAGSNVARRFFSRCFRFYMCRKAQQTTKKEQTTRKNATKSAPESGSFQKVRQKVRQKARLSAETSGTM